MAKCADDAALTDNSLSDYKAAHFTGDQRRAIKALAELGGSLVSGDDWRVAVQERGLWPDTNKTNGAWSKAWSRLKAALIQAGAISESNGSYSINEAPGADAATDFAED